MDTQTVVQHTPAKVDHDVTQTIKANSEHEASQEKDVTASSKKVAYWIKLAQEEQDQLMMLSSNRRKRKAILDSDQQSPNTKLSHAYSKARASNNKAASAKQGRTTPEKLDSDKKADPTESVCRPSASNKAKQQRISRRTDNNATQLTASSKKFQLLCQRKKEEETCSICLSALGEDKGVLVCSHTYCFTCIEKWAQSSNRCPFCRKEFSQIQRGDTKIKVESKQLQVHYDQDYIDTPCYYCGSFQNDQMLILCDLCQNACCHLYCDPDLRLLGGYFPQGEWLCRACKYQRASIEHSISRSLSGSRNSRLQSVIDRILQREGLDQYESEQNQEQVNYALPQEQDSEPDDALRRYIERRRFGSSGEGSIATRTRQRVQTRQEERPRMATRRQRR